MRDDSGESSIQASTPKVACTAGDRGSKADAGCENLVTGGGMSSESGRPVTEAKS